MKISNKAAIIIPARYSSTRFPGKVLVSIGSKPVIQWIYEAAILSKHADNVIVATDEQKIYDTVKGFGGNVVMTSSNLRTGSDRCAEVSQKLSNKIIVNLQADEILQGPEMIDELIQMMEEDTSINMGSLKKEITTPEELLDRNVVKVVTDNSGFALYFSRSPIPYIRDMVDNSTAILGEISANMHTTGLENPVYRDRRDIHVPYSQGKQGSPRIADNSKFPGNTYYKHLGIYAYRRDFILQFAALPTAGLEELEKLEQLRAMECGYKIKLKETLHNSHRIDTPEDLKKLEEGLIHG